MNIKIELLSKEISELVCRKIKDMDINIDSIAEKRAINMLDEIQAVIKNDSYTDFEAIEEIVNIFEQNGVSCGARHDF